MGVASKLSMNWTGVQASYGTTPTIVAIDEVTDLDVDRSQDMKPWYADGAIFPKAMKGVNKRRKLTIKGGNIAALSAIPENTPCTVTGVLNDLNNGTGSGAITVTMINAIVSNNPFKGKNNDYGTGDLTFEAFSTDGVTDPLTITVAP